MLLSRRNVLRACGAAGAVALLPAATGRALAQPDDWFAWLRANRQHVAAVLDDGRGGRVAHRAAEPQPLASAVKVVHLAGYAKAVATGAARPDEEVRVGDWEEYYIGLDGGAHPASLRALGIPSAGDTIADDPNRRVRLDDVVASMIRFSDNAATDFLRHRLGEGVLRAAAARYGRPGAPVPEILTEFLHLILGRPVSAAQYIRDPRVKLEVIGRIPALPGYDGQAAWAGTTWAGSPVALSRIHRALTDVPVARDHLERAGAALGELPPGVAGIGFKGGALPGVITVGMSVRWADGRVGTAAVLTRGLDVARFVAGDRLVLLVRQALLDPGVLREFQVSLS
ncbi:serine hydrolase [Saccharothrix syringae]|uniref:Beta-lactamase n=1 Tax=Saccharothrix syringae TaxID=103733 RepID=A0A5Q0GVL2_SACSY|nr:serine hydrolase [Saccharothrix syringae]QFZ17392.1 hypothetical protein EKG83_07815 [Saccharothrix syringae]